MCPNYTCVFTFCLSIFMHNIYLGYMKQTDVGEGCNFEVITLTTYPFFFKKKQLKMSARHAEESMVLSILDLLCPKPLIITGGT